MVLVDQILLAKAMAKEIALGAVDRLLEPGDKAILTTESQQSLKVVMTGKEMRSPIAIHEYMRFNAKGNAEQMYCKNEAEAARLTLLRGRVLTLRIRICAHNKHTAV